MRDSKSFPIYYSRSSGMSLVELALVLLILSLALAPIVQNIGGPRSSSGTGTVTRLAAQKSKELLLANTITDRALSTDYTVFNCGNSFDPRTSLPAPGQTKSFPASSRCVSNNYNQPLYYQWSVRNMDPTGLALPVGNHYYTAVLNVWSTASGGTPLLTVPTAFYWNDAAVISTQGKTGVMIALDTSGSMALGQVRDYAHNNGWDSTSTYPLSIMDAGRCVGTKHGIYPASPFLRGDRGGVSMNNGSLDVSSFYNNDDPSTPEWNDTFMRPWMLGVGDCQNPWTGGIYDFGGEYASEQGYARTAVSRLCTVSSWYGQGSGTWTAILNQNLSRMEVARSTLLSFLLAMERNSDLYENTKIGFLTYSSDIQVRVYPEVADSNGHFNQLRRKFYWVNRSNGAHTSGIGTNDGPILPDLDTDLYGGVYHAAYHLFQDSSLSSRIILVLGDGKPQCANNCNGQWVNCATAHSDFQNLGNVIGNGTFPSANGNKATIMAMGIMSDTADMPQYLRDDLASRTPNGFYAQANSMAQIKPMFDQIQYQIQRIILLNKASRYNLDFT